MSVYCDRLGQKPLSPDSSSVWQHVKLSDVSLGTRPRDSLVADVDVKKPSTNQSNQQDWFSLSISLRLSLSLSLSIYIYIYIYICIYIYIYIYIIYMFSYYLIMVATHCVSNGCLVFTNFSLALLFAIPCMYIYSKNIWKVSEIEGLIFPYEQKFLKHLNYVMLCINGKLISSRFHICHS